MIQSFSFSPSNFFPIQSYIVPQPTTLSPKASTHSLVPSELPSSTINQSKSSHVCLQRDSYTRPKVCALLYVGVNTVKVFMFAYDPSHMEEWLCTFQSVHN